MNYLHQLVEKPKRSIISISVNGLLVGRLYHLQIPPRELIGKEFECSHERLVETIL